MYLSPITTLIEVPIALPITTPPPPKKKKKRKKTRSLHLYIWESHVAKGLFRVVLERLSTKP